MFSEIKVPSMEEIKQRKNARRDWVQANLTDAAGLHKKAHDNSFDPARINMLSLPAWLKVAELSGTPHIPAELVAEIANDLFESSINAIEDGERGDKELQQVYVDFERKIIDSLDANSVLRMEQVAPYGIKSNLSRGAEMGSGLWITKSGEKHVDLIEDRFLTTLLDLASDKVRAFKRPVLNAQKIAGEFYGDKGFWPVEFRIFVNEHTINGISNYYPQVEMDEVEYRPYAEKALRYAQNMLDIMKHLRIGVGSPTLNRHAFNGDLRGDWVPQDWQAQDFTLDFIVGADDEVYFIEGGPAGMYAAHPCCFEKNEQDTINQALSGMIFALNGKVYPLPNIA